jgi:hypothetical protein
MRGRRAEARGKNIVALTACNAKAVAKDAGVDPIGNRHASFGDDALGKPADRIPAAGLLGLDR